MSRRAHALKELPRINPHKCLWTTHTGEHQSCGIGNMYLGRALISRIVSLLRLLSNVHSPPLARSPHCILPNVSLLVHQSVVEVQLGKSLHMQKRWTLQNFPLGSASLLLRRIFSRIANLRKTQRLVVTLAMSDLSP